MARLVGARLVVAMSTAAATATLLVAAGSAPAAADPPRPTNFVSRVLTVEPPAPGVRIDVLGGDAFLALAVEPGHTVTVPDYGDDGAPYLRVLADGTVQVNEASLAHASNASRYGERPGGSGGDQPRWTTVARNGRHAWHDHRIHLMVPEELAVTDAGGRVDLGGDDGTWAVPLVVDGRATSVQGELLRLTPPTPWPWWALAGVTAGLVLTWAVGLRREVQPALAAAFVVVAGAALGVSVAEFAAAPAGSGASWLTLAGPAVALLAAATALTARVAGGRIGLSRTRREAVIRTALAATTAGLVWWAGTRRGVLDHAIVPSGLPALDRTATSLAIGLGVATALLLVWRPTVLTRLPPTPAS
jgi:hypothetical protein